MYRGILPRLHQSNLTALPSASKPAPIARARRSRLASHFTRSGTLLGSNWGGTTNQFWSDANVWFDARIGSDAAKYQFAGKPWAAWQARGLDPHSVIADPLLVDEKRPELGLRKKSPAFKLGYRQIDLSTLGPRKPAQRK